MNKATIGYAPAWSALSPVKSYLSRPMIWLSQQWTHFVHAISRGHEPRIWQRRNASGDVYYRAYDPYSGRSAYLTSDDALRSWLEKLPYQ